MMPHPARICFALFACLTLAGTTAVPAAPADDAPAVDLSSSKPSHPSEQDVRRKISAGEIRYGQCVSDTLIESGDQPVILFRNSCDVQVSVQLCARRPEDVGENHFGFIVSKQSESRFRLWFKTGQTFTYTYNTCGVAYCMPPDPDC